MTDLFLDTNVMMEIVFQKSKSLICLDRMKNFKNYYISSLSVHICMYYLEKDLPQSVDDFIEIISDMTVLDSGTVFKSFDDYDKNDFEDWLQVNTSLLNNISNFLTLNKQLSKKHSEKLNIILV
jgi:predicted nucleic-acid-binding protein